MAIDHGIGKDREFDRLVAAYRLVEERFASCRVEVTRHMNRFQLHASVVKYQSIYCLIKSLAHFWQMRETAMRYKGVSVAPIKKHIDRLNGLRAFMGSYLNAMEAVSNSTLAMPPFILYHPSGMCRLPYRFLLMPAKVRSFEVPAPFVTLPDHYRPLERMVADIVKGERELEFPTHFENRTPFPLLMREMERFILNLRAFEEVSEAASSHLRSHTLIQLLRSIGGMVDKAILCEAFYEEKGVPHSRNLVSMVEELSIDADLEALRPLLQILDGVYVMEGFTLEEAIHLMGEDQDLVARFQNYDGRTAYVYNLCHIALNFVGEIFEVENGVDFTLFKGGEGRLLDGIEEEAVLFPKPRGEREDVFATHDCLMGSLSQLRTEAYSDQMRALIDQIGKLMISLDELFKLAMGEDDLAIFAAHIDLLLRIAGDIDHMMNRLVCAFNMGEVLPANLSVSDLVILSTRYVSDPKRREKLNHQLTIGSTQLDDVDAKTSERIPDCHRLRIESARLARGVADSSISKISIVREVMVLIKDMREEAREAIEYARLILRRA